MGIGWRRAGPGRDSSLGARSVGGEGGVAGGSWSECPGLRCPPGPSSCRRLKRQVRAVVGRGGPGPERLELRPRYWREPGGRGGMYAARRTATREERPKAWALGGRPRPGSPQNPCAASFLILSLLGAEVALWRAARGPWRGLPAAFSPRILRLRPLSALKWDCGRGVRVGWDLARLD